MQTPVLDSLILAALERLLELRADTRRGMGIDLFLDAHPDVLAVDPAARRALVAEYLPRLAFAPEAVWRAGGI